ncbi:hypothetical protein ACFE04_019009 [Oxalis oulophora]
MATTTTTITGINLTTHRVYAKANDSPKAVRISTNLSQPWRKCTMQVSYRRMVVVRAAPDQIQEKVKESIEAAQETCSDDPASGECVAAWDEVEELSAAASHARDKQKTTDPLDAYCKDNPETDECRTYDS